MKAFLNAAEVAKVLKTDRATVIRWIDSGRSALRGGRGGSASGRFRWRPCRAYSKNMKIISFTIFKGGTGKTTSSVNTAVALVRHGKRVLLVDLDQQASATRYLGQDPESSPSLYQVFLGARSAASAIRTTEVGVDMLTANTYLAAIEQALEPGDELKLAAILRPLKADYDFIIVDSPPGKARLTFNALAASDLIVITCAAERMALDGVADTIGYIQRHLWGKYPELEHQELRILFTMYRNTTTHAPAVAASAQKIWRDNIFGVRIPHAAIFAQSYDQKQPVVAIVPRHPGALAYDALAQLLIPYEDA